MKGYGSAWDQLNKSNLSGYEDDDMPIMCRNPSHNPPGGLYIPEGKRYRHVCPGCGFTVVLRHSGVTL